MNTRELKAEIVRNGLTQEKVAKAIGVSTRTFSTKLKTGNFGLTEARRLTELLNIKDPLNLFFAD